MAAAALAISPVIHADPAAGSIANAANASAVEPAVSSVNGKVDTIYGAINRSYIRGMAGSVSLPIGQRFGAQFDALYAHGFETDIYGYGGHFFTRNPAYGLLGLAVGGFHSTDFNNVLVGVEGEYYFDKITVGGFIGYDNFDSRVRSTFANRLNTQRSYAIARVYASAYLLDNLALTAEWQNRFNKNFAIVRMEWQTPVRGLALYVDGGLGDNHFRYLVGGVRYYFGGSKTLKDRHRKDDPDNINNVFSITDGGGVSGSSSAPPSSPPQVKVPQT